MTFEIQVLSWDRHTNVIVKSSKPNRWHGASVVDCGFESVGSNQRLLGAVVIVCQLDLQLPMQSVPIITRVYSIQHYVIKMVSDLRQVGSFLRLPLNKTDRHDKTEILLKVTLNTITLTLNPKTLKLVFAAPPLRNIKE